MKNVAILNKATCMISKSTFKLRKHSPEILLVTGVAGAVASAVMACVATTKIDEVTKEPKEKIEKIHKALNNEIELTDEYTEEDARKDITLVYAKMGIGLVKLYAPSVVLGALSITSILASNNILRKRNIALAAAYATIDKGFKEYRGRVIDRFGKEIDKELKYNIRKEKIEEVIEDPETGKTKKVKTEVDVVDPHLCSPYSKFFDESCLGWEKDAEHNLMFLRSQQQYANDLLRAKGHLFLNEVYDMLGIERTRAGQIVGWVYDKNGKYNDNYVDFGIYNIHREKSRDFVNGLEKSILLDFNVDGNILDLFY